MKTRTKLVHGGTRRSQWGEVSEALYVIVDAWCNGGSYYCPSSIDPFTLEWQIQLPY